jgi:hypothetical protein
VRVNLVTSPALLITAGIHTYNGHIFMFNLSHIFFLLTILIFLLSSEFSSAIGEPVANSSQITCPGVSLNTTWLEPFQLSNSTCDLSCFTSIRYAYRTFTRPLSLCSAQITDFFCKGPLKFTKNAPCYNSSPHGW